MTKMKNLVKQHNARVLKNIQKKISFNCRVKDNCPLDGKCLHELLCIRLMMLPTMNVKTTLEELKDKLNCGTIIACHLDTRIV